MKFNYERDFKTLDFRAHPEEYQIGVGEQGVLLVEPYKSEILPHWRFATPELARASSETIYAMFLQYKADDDFIGMDMARKFLQMGYTRSRRYANHKAGKKYAGPVPDDKKGQSGAHGREQLPRLKPEEQDPTKSNPRAFFTKNIRWRKDDPDYQRMAARHREKYDGIS